ncbi:hypothetical protein [Halarchaeum acidiphilum]|nr:hypothetical protein [Halarchaeum acidiphilum]
MVASRALLTWFELMVVGIVGGTVGSVLGGPLRYLLYLAVALASVGVLFYNVDAHVTARLDAAGDP